MSLHLACLARMWSMWSMSFSLLPDSSSILEQFTRSHGLRPLTSDRFDQRKHRSADRFGEYPPNLDHMGEVRVCGTSGGTSGSRDRRRNPWICGRRVGVGFPSPEPKVTGSTPVGHTVGNPIGRSCFRLTRWCQSAASERRILWNVSTESTRRPLMPRQLFFSGPTCSTRRAAVAGTFESERTASDGRSSYLAHRRSSTATRSSTFANTDPNP